MRKISGGQANNTTNNNVSFRDKYASTGGIGTNGIVVSTKSTAALKPNNTDYFDFSHA